MTRLRALSAAGAVLALSALVVATPASATPSVPAVPSFGVPRVVDPVHVYGEPDLAVNPKTGAIHASGPQGTGTQRSIWNISVDGGDSYRLVQNVPNNSPLISGAEPTKSLIAPGGGDTEIQIAQNGRTFFNDLAALACFSSITTTDDGATTSTANPAGCSDPGADRQWIALYDPKPGQPTISPYTGPKPLAYMEYQAQAPGGDVVDTSTDGSSYSHKAGEFGNDGTHSPNHTPIIVDQYSGDVLGMTSGGTSNSLALAVGTPNAAGDLTYSYTPVASGLPGSPQTLFPVLTEDTARTLYAVWIDSTTYSVWYSYSPVDAGGAGWTHWSAPAVLSQAPANVNVFPWAAAGGPGVLDVAWYGTDRTLSQLGTAGPSAQAGQSWNLFFSQVTAADSAGPQASQVVASPHPMHYGDICLLGTACVTGQGNRNQADFFKLVLAADGRARIIYTDSSNRLVQTGSDSALDHQGAALDTVITQNTGLNAWTGAPLAANDNTAPRSGVTDPAGDALFKPLGGTNVPGADLRAVAVSTTPTDLVFSVRTAAPLQGTTSATATPFADLVVRWQQGDTLYDAGVEATPAGLLTAYAGPTSSVDLCSVSACKPNYLDYRGSAGSASVTTDTSAPDGSVLYTITVPRSAVGSPAGTTVLEEVAGYTFAQAKSNLVPLTNASAFADEAPLELDGTRTFNAVAGDGSPTPVVPESLSTALLPLLGGAVLLLTVGLRRRTQRG